MFQYRGTGSKSDISDPKLDISDALDLSEPGSDSNTVAARLGQTYPVSRSGSKTVAAVRHI
jgi:hypothetical protein